ncbi:MAG: endonuclease III [Planctomycetota bacterium]
MSQRAVAAIYTTLAGIIEPRSELEFADPYQLLVAVILSAQATDVSVNLAMHGLVGAAPSPQAMVELGEAGLIPYIRRIGLYNAKARHIVAACRQLVERHHGQVPDTRAELEALPGVGRKSASVVLNIAFAHPTIAVDTHVHRVANRTGIAATRTAIRTQTVLERRTPQRYLLNAHHYLILHGRRVCTARKPACPACAIARWCRYSDKTQSPSTSRPSTRRSHPRALNIPSM